MLTIEDEGTLVALVWLTEVFSEKEVAELHLCARPEYHGRWLTRPVLRIGLPWLAEYDHIVAVHGDPRFKRMLNRLGFDTAAPHMNIRG